MKDIFQPRADSELVEHLLSDESPTESVALTQRRPANSRIFLHSCSQLALLILYFTLGFYVSLWVRSTDGLCTKKHSWPCTYIPLLPGLACTDQDKAPALGAIGSYINVQFKGTLGRPSRFIGHGPEVDAAWDEIHGDGRSEKATCVSNVCGGVIADQET